MSELDLTKTYTLQSIIRKTPRTPSFFRDRYFPTDPNTDIFSTAAVLVDYRKDDTTIGAFVADGVPDIPIKRGGFETHMLEPARISHSTTLKASELELRGFGESIYTNADAARRAAMFLRDDLAKLDRVTTLREEWMSAQTMINNSCTMQEYVDAKTKGGVKHVKFYEDTSDHVFTVENAWNGSDGDFWGDVEAMAMRLIDAGLPAADLVLGTDAASYIKDDPKVRDLLSRDLQINAGAINEELLYPGVVRMGRLNFGGVWLTLYAVSEQYRAENGAMTRYFPATSAMVTAPGCGHMMYGAVTQRRPGSDRYNDFETIAAARVPKVIVNNDDDMSKLRLQAKPLAAPKNYCPYIYAADVVG